MVENLIWILEAVIEMLKNMPSENISKIEVINNFQRISQKLIKELLI